MTESEKEIEDKGLFQVVLDDDEEVIQVIRPHKGRAWFGMIVGLILLTLVMVPFGIMMIVFHDQGDSDSLGAGIGALVFWGILTAFGIVSIALWSHKTVYAWTNKRVLIRTGYIGVDYKSLDLTMVGALSVNFTMVDKLLRRNKTLPRCGTFIQYVIYRKKVLQVDKVRIFICHGHKKVFRA